MDALHALGIRAAAALQSGPPWLEGPWLWLSAAADPRRVFSTCFPLAFFLDPDVGLAVLWAGLLAEWLNVVLKWLLFGERPFWWLHESGFARRHRLLLRQFPISCETGPGSPSGHCMIMGAALWPLVTALAALAARRCKSPAVRLIPFGAYALLLLAVGLSRVFVLAHFPHQVLGGIVAGAALGWGLQARTPAARPLRFHAATALGLLLGALALHRLMGAAGVDVDWSLRLAAAWCSDPSWLRLDTRPFASVCRAAGSALGLGLAAGPPRQGAGGAWEPLPPPARPRLRVLGALLAAGLLEGLQRVPQPAAAPLWYGATFLKQAAGPWLVAVAVPRLLRACSGPPRPPHAE